MDPNGVAPLTGVVEITTDVPTSAKLTLSSDQDIWSVDFEGLHTTHSLPVLGLKPDRFYEIQVRLTDRRGDTQNLVLNTVTGPLPADFPVIDIFFSDPANMEPGYIMMDRFRRFSLPGEVYSIIVDNEGDVVWYSTSGGQDGMRRLPNGNLLQLDSSELTLLGELISPRVLDVPGLFLHHDLFPAESGEFFSLSYNIVSVDNFPTSEIDPNAPTETTNVYSDIVVELLPDGSLANSWDLTDIIDSSRIGYDSTKPGFPFFDIPDWSHSNAVAYDSRDDSIIVSVRHQDAVIKFARETGQLVWILGPHDNWAPEYQPFILTPVGTPFEWQYHQHAPMVTPDGTLLMFDNGNHRASPFDGKLPRPEQENYSRAVEFAIDEVNMEIRQVWEYGAGLEWSLYAPTQGDADWMPNTGNVLLTFSDTRFIAGAPSDDWGLGTRHTSIIEVDHQTPANKFFDMRVYNPVQGGSIWVYRSEKIPSLYADNVVVINDSDKDRVLDDRDNCILAPNSDQRDSDGDGFGNICDPDLDNDGVVDYVDLFWLQGLFLSSDPHADFDGDGIVSFFDLEIMVSFFFGGPGPSALTP